MVGVRLSTWNSWKDLSSEHVVVDVVVVGLIEGFDGSSGFVVVVDDSDVAVGVGDVEFVVAAVVVGSFESVVQRSECAAFVADELTRVVVADAAENEYVVVVVAFDDCLA